MRPLAFLPPENSLRHGQPEKNLEFSNQNHLRFIVFVPCCTWPLRCSNLSRAWDSWVFCILSFSEPKHQKLHVKLFLVYSVQRTFRREDWFLCCRVFILNLNINLNAEVFIVLRGESTKVCFHCILFLFLHLFWKALCFLCNGLLWKFILHYLFSQYFRLAGLGSSPLNG